MTYLLGLLKKTKRGSNPATIFELKFKRRNNTNNRLRFNCRVAPTQSIAEKAKLRKLS